MTVEEVDHQLFDRGLEELAGAMAGVMQHIQLGFFLQTGVTDGLIEGLAAQLQRNNGVVVAVDVYKRQGCT